MISLIFSLLLTKAFAISADPKFGMSASDRAKYFDLSVRSTVAIHASDERRCTGTLVSPTQVLTSAHCFDSKPDQPKPTFKVLLMANALAISSTLTVKKIDVNPLWLMGLKDIAGTNAKIKKIQADVNRMGQALSADCALKDDNLSDTALRAYLVNLVNSGKPPANLCERTSVKVYNLLIQNKKLFEIGLRDGKHTRPGDLAVAELSEAVTDGFHRPMRIDYDFESIAGDTRLAFISGFGMTTPKIELTDPVDPLNIGFTEFRGMAKESSDLMVIAGGAVICPGDSGGPTAYVQDGQMILVGVNAGTTLCDFKTGSGHSLSIKAHSDWLLSILAK